MRSSRPPPGWWAVADTTPREWALAVGGGLALAAALVWLSSEASDAPMKPPVTLTAAPVAQPRIRPSVQPPAMQPAMPPAIPGPPVVTLPAGGHVLRGVMVRGGGGAAIIEAGDGRQRLVRVGGQVAPGVTLVAVAAGSAVLLSGGTRQTLLLDGSRPVPVVTAGGKVDMLAATADDYRIGLKPVREDGRIIGYRIADVSRLPVFRMAGLQPGDMVVAISGQALQAQEKLLELPAEIAGSNTVVIDYRRGGAPATATVKIAR